MARADIHKALSKHLYNNFSLPDNIIWENFPMELTLTEYYFQEYYMPTDTEQKTLGSSGEMEDFGLYQISIFSPIGVSTTTAESYVEEISGLFKSGTILTEASVSVFINKSTPAQGFKQDNWYITPITISWSCYLPIN